jgi:hypothetical protein
MWFRSVNHFASFELQPKKKKKMRGRAEKTVCECFFCVCETETRPVEKDVEAAGEPPFQVANLGRTVRWCGDYKTEKKHY